MTQRYAVVTGAGTGIGRAAARSLMADGWKVAVLGRRLAPLEETIAGHEGSFAVAADVGEHDQVQAAFAQVEKRFGRLDVLFNNAGRGAPAVDFDELSVENWMAVVAANLHGSFHCAQAAYRIMKHQSPKGGRIINNGSISAHAPRPGAAAYTSTKHAITGLTKQINLDGRKHDITAGQIDVGNAATPMTERMAVGVMQPGGEMMVEPRMDVEHVGRAVAHMAALPLEANIPFMTIMATKMPFLGRG